jgi:hypothetical protein
VATAALPALLEVGCLVVVTLFLEGRKSCKKNKNYKPSTM